MSEENEQYLEHFSAEISRYRKMMQEAFDGVLNEGVSLYPVFVFHQQDVTVGLPIADRNHIAGDWSVNISTLEEFYIRGIVGMDQVEEIKQKINGMPQQYCCLVLSEENGGFVFLNRDEEE